MKRPVVGIIGNRHTINDRYPAHAGGQINVSAAADVAGCMPLIIPADPRYVSVAELMEVCDGFMLTGGRPNVHPEEYGETPTEAHGDFDRARDAITLPLVRACLDRGQPFLAICRGFQEVNVAMGGSLHPEIRDLPGRDNHRMPPEGTMEEQFALRHTVRFTPGGVFPPIDGRRVGDDQQPARPGRGRNRASHRDRRLGAGRHARGALRPGCARASASACNGTPNSTPPTIRQPAAVHRVRRCRPGLGTDRGRGAGRWRGPAAGRSDRLTPEAIPTNRRPQ